MLSQLLVGVVVATAAPATAADVGGNVAAVGRTSTAAAAVGSTADDPAVVLLLHL